MTNQSDEIKVPGFMREKRSNVNNQTFNQTQTEEVQVPKKNRKRLKKIGFVAAELVYGAVAIGGAFYAHEQYKNYKDRQKADNLVNSYVSESVCVLPQSLYTANNYAFKYCDGTNLEQALQESNIDALVIGDTVYTEKGSEIAKIDAIVEYKDYENFTTFEANDGSFKVIPEGYTMDGNRISKTNQFEKTIYLPVNKDGVYEGVQTADGYTISEVISTENIPTVKYEALAEQELIIDVHDETESATKTNSGTLKLVRKSGK